jgi:NADH:ubiquinone oxidoreductase subunit 2 (subunit N)
MISSEKNKKSQLVLSKIMFFAWLIASIACVVVAFLDYQKNSTENTWQYFVFFAISALMAIYRYAIMKRYAKQID